VRGAPKGYSEADLAKETTAELRENLRFLRSTLDEARASDDIERGLRNAGVYGTYENMRHPGGSTKLAKAQIKAIEKELKRRRKAAK
jgi:hypothetical protein